MSINQGTYNIGAGRDYSNLYSGLANIESTFSGNLTFVLYDDVTPTGDTQYTFDLNGYTFTIQSYIFNTDIQNLPKIQASNSGACFLNLNCGSGIVDLHNLVFDGYNAHYLTKIYASDFAEVDVNFYDIYVKEPTVTGIVPNFYLYDIGFVNFTNIFDYYKIDLEAHCDVNFTNLTVSGNYSDEIVKFPDSVVDVTFDSCVLIHDDIISDRGLPSGSWKIIDSVSISNDINHPDWVDTTGSVYETGVVPVERSVSWYHPAYLSPQTKNYLKISSDTIATTGTYINLIDKNTSSRNYMGAKGPYPIGTGIHSGVYYIGASLDYPTFIDAYNDISSILTDNLKLVLTENVAVTNSYPTMSSTGILKDLNGYELEITSDNSLNNLSNAHYIHRDPVIGHVTYTFLSIVAINGTLNLNNLYFKNEMRMLAPITLAGNSTTLFKLLNIYVDSLDSLYFIKFYDSEDLTSPNFYVENLFCNCRFFEAGYTRPPVFADINHSTFITDSYAGLFSQPSSGSNITIRNSALNVDKIVNLTSFIDRIYAYNNIATTSQIVHANLGANVNNEYVSGILPVINTGNFESREYYMPEADSIFKSNSGYLNNELDTYIDLFSRDFYDYTYIGVKAYHPRTTSFYPTFNKNSNINKKSDFPIAALEYKDFSPNKIINVESKENSIYENTEEYNYIETLNKNNNVYTSSDDYRIWDDKYDFHEPTSGNHFEFNHYHASILYRGYQKFLVTNYYSDSQNGVPLFYQYEPLYNISSNTSGIVNFTIYKNDNIIVNSNQYITQFSYDLLNNENSRYDSTTWGNITNTGIHRTRFLLPLYFSDKDTYYTLEYTKNISGVSEYQKELIELRDVYTSDDFNTIEIWDKSTDTYQCGGLMVYGSIPSGVTTLSVVKDPYTKIRPLDIINMDDSSNPSWNLRFSYGSLFTREKYGPIETGGEIYYPRSNNSVYYTGIHPDFITPSLINIKSNLDLSGYSYPNYSVPTGNFNIKVNGVTRDDIKITSVDSKKGYIQLNKSLDKTDDITTTFKVANGDWWPVDLELNPTKSGSVFNTYPNGFGLAMESYTSGLITYDYNSESLASDQKSLCYVTLNHLSPEFIKLTDARRTAGLYDRPHLKNWFYNKYGYYHRDFDWYSDITRYDGLVLSRGGTIIINIPNDKLESERTKWINHYKTIMDNNSAEIKANEEFNFYLDQMIRRNISAGSDYIIVPTISGEITGAIWNG